MISMIPAQMLYFNSQRFSKVQIDLPVAPATRAVRLSKIRQTIKEHLQCRAHLWVCGKKAALLEASKQERSVGLNVASICI